MTFLQRENKATQVLLIKIQIVRKFKYRNEIVFPICLLPSFLLTQSLKHKLITSD